MSNCLKEKLKSRKLWATVISVLLSAKVIFFSTDVSQEQITALITAASTLIAYIFGQSAIDCKKLNSEISNTSLTSSSQPSKPFDEKQQD